MAANLLVKVMMDTTRIASGVDEVNGKLGKFGQTATRVGSLFAGAFAGGEIIRFADNAITAASDLNETLSKSKVIFGNAADAIEAFGDTAAKSIGQSKQQAVNAAATFGVFGKVAGLTGGDLSKFSTDMTVLASDLASFSNTTPEEAIQALAAALRGEMEPIRRYGVILDDAAIRSKAMEMGIYDGSGALTAQQKVLAVNRLLFEKTTDAQGDFARTAGGAANKARIMTASFADMKTTIGQKLLPIKQKLLDIIIRAIDWFQKLNPKVRNAIIIVGGLVIAAGALTLAIGALAVAVNAATWPVLLVVAVIAALIAGFVLAYKKSETFRNAVDTVARFVRDEVVPALKDLWSWVKEKLAPVMKRAADEIRERWELFKAWWAENWPRIQIILEEAWARIKIVVQEALAFIKEFWRVWGDDIITFLGGFWTAASNTFAAFFNIIGGIVSFFLAVMSGDWKGALLAIGETTSEVFNNIQNIFRGQFDMIRGIVGGAWEWIKITSAQAFDFILSLPGRLWALGGMLADVLGGAARYGVNALISALESGINGAIRGANRVTDNLPFGLGFRIPEVNIPRLARGGIVTGPTLALIGEAGPEAVVPLSGANAARMGGGTYNISVNVAPGANPADTGRAIVDAIKAFERSNSAGWRGAA